MSLRLGVIMDTLSAIHPKKDSTLAMIEEALKRGWAVDYMEPRDLSLQEGQPYGHAQSITLTLSQTPWYQLASPQLNALSSYDILLMRKDPPFDEMYLYATYILEHAERQGVLVANRPQSLRDANEKLFTTLFPEWMPTTLVSANQQALRDFLKKHGDIVCKPLNSMGGTSVFRVKQDDVNMNVIFETLTSGGQTYIMAQVYLPSIREGDKRILMINGEPIPHVLARVPQDNDWRGNLAVGAQPRIQALSARDREITEAIGPQLRERGLIFVGLDVIGDSLTEINVTSPTGIREIEAATGYNAAAAFLDSLAQLKS